MDARIEKGSDASLLSAWKTSIKATYKIPDILANPAITKLVAQTAKATTQASIPSGPESLFGDNLLNKMLTLKKSYNL